MPAAFLQKLNQATIRSQSLLCIGLDPAPARTPANDLLRFNQEIIEATHDLAAAYKPNLAFYEARGRPGLQALADTIDRIRITAPTPCSSATPSAATSAPRPPPAPKPCFQPGTLTP